MNKNKKQNWNERKAPDPPDQFSVGSIAGDMQCPDLSFIYVAVKEIPGKKEVEEQVEEPRYEIGENLPKKQLSLQELPWHQQFNIK